MKKLRMIVTSVIVLAIVGAAFAFKTKSGVFCVRTGTTNGNCTTVKKNFYRTTDTEAPEYRYFQNWDGWLPLCIQDAGGNCNVQVFLTTD